MNCIKCYQEIPEGSRFCPYCGAEQTPVPQPAADEQITPTVESQAETTTDVPVQPGTSYQNTQNYGQGAQDSSGYGSGYGSGYQGGYQNNPYQSPYQQNQGQPVNWVPYLVLSIISTICCCPPFGIVAIVFSAKINSALNSGNTEEAEKSAKTAKIWIIVAFAAGIISYILYFVLIGFIGATDYYYY